MATNKKISELPEFTAGQLADDDLIVMVDVSDSTTKKVQTSTFRATVSGVATLSANAPLSADVPTGDVTISLGTVAINKGGTGATDAATARTNLGLAIGTDVQAYDAGLTDIAGLAVTDGNIIVGNGTNWVAESGATARTSLGLGTIATQDANNVNITGGSISGVAGFGDVSGPASSTDNAVARFDSTTGKLIQNSTVTVSDTGDVAAASLTLTTDLAVADGGTGASDAATARTNLGLGSISTQDSSNVTITGGSISGITDLAVADGGTGASDAATARSNLGVTITNVSDQANSSTGWIDLPAGTDGERGSPTSGAIRFNTTSTAFEGYNGSAWGALGGSISSVSDQANTSTGWLDLPAGTDGERGSPTSGAVRFNTTSTVFEGYDGSAWGALATEAYVDALSLGKILQVQSVIKTDTYSMSSTTAADVTGLTVSITPASASNKILVLAQVNGCQGVGGNGIFRLLRDSTEIGSNALTYTSFGMASSSYPNSSFSNSIFYVDSPATTSPTTYKIQVRVDASGTIYVNRRSPAADMGGTSQIVVLEIAA